MENSSEDLRINPLKERETESARASLVKQGGCKPGSTLCQSCPSRFLDRQKDWLLEAAQAQSSEEEPSLCP